MYFIPRFTKGYVTVAHLKPFYRYLLTLALLGAAISIWFFGMYRPIARKIYANHQDIARINQQYMVCQQARIASEALSDTIRTESRSIRKNRHRPAHDQFQESVSTIFNLLTQSGLDFRSYSTGKENNNGWHHISTITLDVSGSYEHMIYFFELMHASDMLASIESVRFEHSDSADMNMQCVLALHSVK